MMESRSSTQFVHLQPATNGNTSIRRGSLPDRNLSSTTLNCSQTYFKGVSSHRRASSDAAGSTSLSCRAVLPALFLERKGPKPFIQTPMSPKALPICFTPLPPSIDRKIPEDKVHDPMFLELSHASRLCGVSRDQNCEGSSRSIYREESMIKNWLSRNPPGVAQSFSLQSIDDIKDDGEMCLPLDRMSLALFNFASTPNRSRISPSGKAALLSERNDENCRVVSRDSLSTLSISLDELLVEDEEVIPSKTNLHENNSPSSKSSTNPLMQDHGLHMNYASKPPFFASSNPGCGENPKSRSRLRDRKPKEMTLDLRLVSFELLNTRCPSNELLWWNCSETPSTDTQATQDDKEEPFEREETAISETADYPFPRMNLMEQKYNQAFGVHAWITAEHQL